MKVCVYGCGAIGSLLAARLTHAGADDSAVARGPHLEAMLEHGLTLVAPDGEQKINARFGASEEPTDLGVQDVVFLTLKSHTLPDIAADIQPLLGPDTMVVTACNGIPWWYTYGLADDFGITEIASVDPGRQLWHAINPERAVGCVVYPAASIIEPGIVQHVFGNRFGIGEPAGGNGERIQQLAALLQAGSFEADIDPDIRVSIWTKLVANAAYNPVSLITGKSLAEMIDDAATNNLLTKIMFEVIDVAAALNIQVPLQPDQLHQLTRQLGNHKTSMLQDYEAGRSMELESMVGSVGELARARNIVTPGLDMVYALAVGKIHA